MRKSLTVDVSMKTLGSTAARPV